MYLLARGREDVIFYLSERKKKESASTILGGFVRGFSDYKTAEGTGHAAHPRLRNGQTVPPTPPSNRDINEINDVA